MKRRNMKTRLKSFWIYLFVTIVSGFGNQVASAQRTSTTSTTSTAPIPNTQARRPPGDIGKTIDNWVGWTIFGGMALMIGLVVVGLAKLGLAIAKGQGGTKFAVALIIAGAFGFLVMTDIAGWINFTKLIFPKP
jgi:hypothetical protein